MREDGYSGVEVINSSEEMQEIAEELRLSGKTLALVPTMGFFHEGHQIGRAHV